MSEKSWIQAIGMLLMDFTSRALTAISATISLGVRPFSAARDLVTPARLMSGFASMCAFVASIRTRPRQSIPFSASRTFTQCTARITTSHSAAWNLVPAMAPGPRSVTKSTNVSGPLEFGHDHGMTSGDQMAAECTRYLTGTYKTYFHKRIPFFRWPRARACRLSDCCNQLTRQCEGQFPSSAHRFNHRNESAAYIERYCSALNATRREEAYIRCQGL